MSVTATRFLTEMFGEIAPGHHAVICAFECDPYEAGPREWCGMGWWPGRKIPRHFGRQNAYLTVSSFRPADDRIPHRRRKELFVALHGVMIDDIGNAANSKVSPDRANRLPLSALIETSPGNHQGWLFIQQDSDSRDLARAQRLIERMIAAGLTADGADPGMKGVTRYGRLPIGVNNKAKYVAALGAPFPVRCCGFNPERRYTIRAIAEAFGLDMTPEPVQQRRPSTEAEVAQSFQQFAALIELLKAEGMYRGQRGPWHEITCPWEEHHTSLTATGTALAEPSEANNWAGGFRCHHGHCSGDAGPQRSIGDVWRWADGLAAREATAEEAWEWGVGANE